MIVASLLLFSVPPSSLRTPLPPSPKLVAQPPALNLSKGVTIASSLPPAAFLIGRLGLMLSDFPRTTTSTRSSVPGHGGTAEWRVTPQPPASTGHTVTARGDAIC